MIVRIRLFAVLRERAGSEWVDLDLDEGATASDALQALRTQDGLWGTLDRIPVALAVNRDYAAAHTPLGPGDELALIPPLSGGSSQLESGSSQLDSRAVRVRIGERPLSLQGICRAVADPRCGAVVVFQGVTREVRALHYEAYREMAREKLQGALAACAARHEIAAIAAEHRTGRVPLGEPSVIVAVSAPHRAAAFAAAREAIDEIKRQVPIWKRELDEQGDVDEQGGEWVAGVPAPQLLTHLNGRGEARMVDVAGKPVSERRALARARVRMSPATARALLAGELPKGEALATARLAGVMGGKRTSELIPLAHPIELDFVDVRTEVDVERGVVELVGEARVSARTGVEMEAMTACAVGALTVYDMVKGVERGVRIEELVLLEKTGGCRDWSNDAVH